MTTMPQLQAMQWDFKEQLLVTEQQAVNSGAAPQTLYIYDSTGQRARKINTNPDGSKADERIYLGSYEIYRDYSNGSATEIQTLHVMDDKQRIAIVETQNGNYTGHLDRYLFSNHLGSAVLELDRTGNLVISYEEYYPYGSTSYQAVSSQVASAKRYRYTGKEKDKESGFYYHGARYYAPWLGRWTSSDPEGLVNGPDTYAYTRDCPTRFVDPMGTQVVGDNPPITPGKPSPKASELPQAVEHSPDQDASSFHGKLNALKYSKLTKEERKLLGAGLGGQTQVRFGGKLKGKVGERVLKAVFQTASATHLDPMFLLAALFEEGLGNVVDKIKKHPKAHINTYYDLGMDRFTKELPTLKNQGLLPKGFTQFSTKGQPQIGNERNENVQVAQISGLEQSVRAFGAMLANRERLVEKDLKALGVDRQTVSDEQLEFWTYVYYNAGSGGPEDPKGRGREHLVDSWLKGDDAKIPSGKMEAPHDTSESLGNAQRVIFNLRLFKLFQEK